MTRYSTSSSSPDFKGAVGKVPQADCSSPISVKEKNNCSTESSTLEQNVNLDAMDCGGRNERIETQTTESKFKGINTSEMYNCQCDETPTESIVNFSKDFNNCPDDESKRLEAVFEPPADRQARFEKSDVCCDCSHAAEDGRDSVSTVSSMSTCNAENDSIREKNEQNLSLPTNHSYDRYSGSIESEDDDDDEESSEMKRLLQNAAESLICISLADSAFAHDCNTKTESNEMKMDKLDQPQHSSDSFELLILNQVENNEDDEFSVSSQFSEVTNVENMNISFKLRRGRRLKDFQREILPGLSCLSRHEICEDINIMETVLRSREYRKIRGKMQDGQKWCTPKKSKLSRLNTARRRIIL